MKKPQKYEKIEEEVYEKIDPDNPPDKYGFIKELFEKEQKWRATTPKRKFRCFEDTV